MSIQVTVYPKTDGHREATQERRAAAVSYAGLVGYRMQPRDQMTDLDRTWVPHMPARKLRTFLGAYVWDRYLKITCVRNPFARVISHFHWGATYQPPKDRDESPAAFERFVRGPWQKPKPYKCRVTRQTQTGDDR